jgi:3-isopropylmalate dehydratase small subunit
MSKVVYRAGDDVSTDAIYPGRFMATVLPSETPQFCFADDKTFNGALQRHEFAPGSVVVANQNFGCGSSREQAASTLKGASSSRTRSTWACARSSARISRPTWGTNWSSAPRR